MSEIHSDKTTGLFQALRQMAEEEEVQEVLASHEEEYNLPPSCCSDDNIKVCSSTSEYRFNEVNKMYINNLNTDKSYCSILHGSKNSATCRY